MQKKKAIIVVGPESSGTRLLTRLFMAAGCDGDANAEVAHNGWPQRWDTLDPADGQDIVIRRSLPYHPFRKWPDIRALAKRFRKLGYLVKIVTIDRNDKALAASQVAHGWVSTKKQSHDEHEACRMIMKDLKPVYSVKYEALVKNPTPTINKMLKALGFTPLKKLPEKIFDGNSKYTEGGK